MEDEQSPQLSFSARQTCEIKGQKFASNGTQGHGRKAEGQKSPHAYPKDPFSRTSKRRQQAKNTGRDSPATRWEQN